MNALNNPIFTIATAALAGALDLMCRVVERRNTIPILSNVMFDVREGGVILTGTDLDIQAYVEMPAAVTRTGRFTVAATALRDAVKRMSAEHVEFDVASRCAIAAGAQRMALPTLPTDDFPALVVGDAVSEFELSGNLLADAFNALMPAVSTEETRYYLNGIFMHVPNGEALRMAATDGHRLVRVSHDVPEGAATLPDVIVPRKTCGLIARLAKGERVKLAFNESKCVVQIGRVKLVSKLIDGTFPDYSRVIPSVSGQHDIQIDNAAACAAAVKRVASVASEKTRAIAFKLSADELNISCSSPENGVAAETVECRYSPVSGYGGLEAGYNAPYLLSMLALAPKGGGMRIETEDATAPSRITFPGRAELLAVIMPMRVGGGVDVDSVTNGGAAAVDTFKVAFGTAYTARDETAMREAVALYRNALHGAGAEATVKRVAFETKVTLGATGKGARGVRRAAAIAKVRTPQGHGSFMNMAWRVRSIVQAARLCDKIGLHPSDPRHYARVRMGDGKTFTVLVSDLRDTSAGMIEVYKRNKWGSYSRVYARNRYTAVVRTAVVELLGGRDKAERTAIMVARGLWDIEQNPAPHWPVEINAEPVAEIDTASVQNDSEIGVEEIVPEVASPQSANTPETVKIVAEEIVPPSGDVQALLQAVAALTARVAALEGGEAGAETARLLDVYRDGWRAHDRHGVNYVGINTVKAKRTPAHLRAIRAYLALRKLRVTAAQQAAVDQGKIEFANAIARDAEAALGEAVKGAEAATLRAHNADLGREAVQAELNGLQALRDALASVQLRPEPAQAIAPTDGRDGDTVIIMPINGSRPRVAA